MGIKENFKVGDKVRHGSRKWYQQCVVIEVEDGCNGRVKVLTKDAPIYDITDPRCSIKGFGEDTAFFCPQDLIKI